MHYRQLGSSGLTVSVVGLGCNNFGKRIDVDATKAVVHAALDAGITLFDVADIYGHHDGAAEELLGQALAGSREEVVLATKFGMDMLGANGTDWGVRGSRRYIRRAIEGSLRRLRTDHLDLYQYHEPDGVTPIEETLAALDDLVREGKVRYLGSSNFDAWQVADADWTARTAGCTRFVSAQNEYSLLRRDVEAELVPACLRFGVGLLPYYPLAAGLLTGKYRRGEPAPAGGRIPGDAAAELLASDVADRLDALGTFAEQRALSMLDVAIGALAALPAVASVIAGATSPEQVARNVAAARWLPDAADLAALDEIVPPPRKEHGWI